MGNTRAGKRGSWPCAAGDAWLHAPSGPGRGRVAEQRLRHVCFYSLRFYPHGWPPNTRFPGLGAGSMWRSSGLWGWVSPGPAPGSQGCRDPGRSLLDTRVSPPDKWTIDHSVKHVPSSKRRAWHEAAGHRCVPSLPFPSIHHSLSPRRDGEAGPRYWELPTGH